jgi:hypothetical protein
LLDFGWISLAFRTSSSCSSHPGAHAARRTLARALACVQSRYKGLDKPGASCYNRLAVNPFKSLEGEMNEKYALVVEFEDRGSHAFVRVHVDRLDESERWTFPLEYSDGLWKLELVAYLDKDEGEALYVSTHYRNGDWIEYERAVQMTNWLKLIENVYRRDLSGNPTVGDYLGSLYNAIGADCIYVVWPEGYEREKFWYYPELVLPQIDEVVADKLERFDEHHWPKVQ